MPKMNNVKSNFMGNVLTLLTGTAFAQVLPILASPILTRLYTPKEFGDFGLFIAIIGILSVIAGLKYELAIALPKDDKKAVNILILSIIISLIISIICLIFVFSIKVFPISIISNKRLEIIIWLLPVMILLMGTFQALLNWGIRKKKFKEIAMTQFYRSTTIVVGQISTGLLFQSSLTLIISQMIGQFVALIHMFKRLSQEIYSLKKYISRKNILEQLIKYKRFPIFYSWSALLNTASVQLPLFMLALFFNSTVVGFYTLANRVLTTPISIVGTAIAQPYLQQAAEKYRSNELGVFSLDIFKVLLSIGLIPILLISISATEIFTLIFGVEWAIAGTYVQLLAIWLLCVFISSPLTNIYTILELQKESLNFNIVLFLSRIVILIIGGLIGNDLIAIALFGLTGALLLLFQINWLLNKTGVATKSVMNSIWIEFLSGLPYLMVMLIIKFILRNELLIFCSTVIILLIFSYLKLVKINSFNKREKVNKIGK